MKLELPPAYSAIEHSDCFGHARELAENGAEEGTIVYTAHDNDNDYSDSSSQLEFSIIIQPEFDTTRARQLQIVAAMSLGEAIAAVIEPMVTLRYGWPGDIRLNDLSVAMCSVSLPSSEDLSESATTPAWATVDVRVLIDGPVAPTFTTVNEHCETAIPDTVIMETFCRNFLASINRWATEGLAVTTKSWQSRFDCHENETVKLNSRVGDITGTIEGLDADATLLLNVDGRQHQITLADAIAWESTRFDDKLPHPE